MSKFISDKLKSLFKSAPTVAAAVTAQNMKPCTVLAVATTAQKLTAQMKPHLPLIRFRKDSSMTGTTVTSGVSNMKGSSSAPPPSEAKAKEGSTIALSTIEDWEIPQRYKRRPIDTDEIEYINRGGPA